MDWPSVLDGCFRQRGPGLEPGRTILTGIKSRRAVKPQVKQWEKTINELLRSKPLRPRSDFAVMNPPAAGLLHVVDDHRPAVIGQPRNTSWTFHEG